MKIAILGYGKMGKEIEQIALERKHEIILKVDAGNALNFSEAELKKADAVIEFSTPSTVVNNIHKCFANNIPVVVGTTGWLDHLEEIKKACKDKNQTLFYSSNYSIGVNIFFKLNEVLAQMMSKHGGYDVSMNEIHHVHKLDAPSGTAITLADQIIENFPAKKKWVKEGSFNTNELSIFSERTDEVPGTHIVTYHSSIDDIEIKHTAHNRKGFALGAVLAAEFIEKKKGIFGMKDLLNN